MIESAFAYTLRLLLCPNCGAPLRTPPEGGEVRCAYCDAVSLFLPRRELPERIRTAPPAPEARSVDPEAPADPEAQRLARLRTQRDDKTRVSPYDITRVPPGLEALARGSLAGTLDALRAEWTACRAGCRPGSVTLEDQRRLFFLTHLIRSAAGYDDKPEIARAIAETALDVFEDPGFRHAVRCMLASSAVRVGDLAAADGWLSTCDPAPDVLELDTDHRLARANLALARGDFQGVLSHVGEVHDGIPLDAAGAPVATLYRVHALEHLGDLVRARAEMTWLCSHSFKAGGGAAVAKRILAAQQWRGLCATTAPMVDLALRAATRRVWIALAVIMVIVGAPVALLVSWPAGLVAAAATPVALVLVVRRLS
jgi:LSD1 subclass zinc finger protein